MKPSSSFFNVLGVALALTVPAVVVAQQFAANQPLRSVDLQALVDRVAALEAGTGPSAQRIGQLNATVVSAAITARSDGFIVAVPGGSGFGSTVLQAQVSLDSREFRQDGGATMTVIISAGETATITADNIVEQSVTLRWYGLHANGALPTCPACAP
jgi:hypothetical protein